MGKGAGDKQTGFWMFMEHFIRPKLQRELGRRVGPLDLMHFGMPQWADLSYEERQEWKKKAKEYNNSEVGKNERMLKRLEYHRRNYYPADFSQPSTSGKSKSKIELSFRYDEIDQYSRKYFAGIDDDFEAKRENDRKKFIDHYQWRFTQKECESKKDFFYETEIIIVTANIYYEDSSSKRMIPSEISILKFSLNRGIYGKRHYILGFAKNGILCENNKVEAEENEQMTGLLMDCDRISANVRFDYMQVWDEIKAFTRIDSSGEKLLLLSKDWNTVVGSFDTLFMHANEKSFSRVEAHFATLEDYFMALYSTVNDVRISDAIKSDVAMEMNEQWHNAVFYDLITCDFHAELKYTEQYQARSCSLFAAHKAIFNFFTLCKKHVFPSCKFIEQHMPNKKLLSINEDNFLELISQQQPHLRSSKHAASYSSVENISKQLMLPKKIMLKSEEATAMCNTGNAEPAYSETDSTLVDLSLIDNDSDTELFCDASIPHGFLMPASQQSLSEGYQNDSFLKMSNQAKQTSALSLKEIEAANMQKSCCSQSVSTYNTCPVSSKSSEIFLSKVNQDEIVSSNGPSTEFSSNLLSYSPKLPSTSIDNLLPVRTLGGFCIPNVCQTNYSCNQPTALTLSRKMGIQQTNIHESTNPEVKIAKPLILEPIICKEAEMFGWSENLQNNDLDEKFVRWLDSAYFEPMTLKE
uniref:Maelstrom domain-containing protein n=1 Tax=Wuchereria bancrofti TaxID=6293 RepID=A0AAF5PYX8_WUCBA